MKKIRGLFLFLTLMFLISSCWFRRYETSNITGWDYNVPQGGFQKMPFEPMETPPGMALVHGIDLYKYPHLSKTITVENNNTISIDSFISSFFVSRYEETNFQYRHYLNYLKRTEQLEEYKKSLPDTSVWMDCDIPNEKAIFLVSNYFQNSTFDLYPVVGLNEAQILNYSKWKTDRLNEAILIREGVIDYSEDPTNLFTTEKYLNNQYDAEFDILVVDSLNPNKKIGARRVRMEDGILLPRMRLLTEKEWIWANLCIGNSKNKHLVTPKEYKQKKMDPDKHFSYLYLPSTKKSNNEMEIFLFSIGVFPVNFGEKNNYLIHHLNSNVSELMEYDNLSNVVNGGSWKIKQNNHSANYEFVHKDSLNYNFQNNFEEGNKFLKPSALIGFRLAMDYIGTINEANNKWK